jgi:hypothetical protein
MCQLNDANTTGIWEKEPSPNISFSKSPHDNSRSKNRRFAFQTFTETPANTPSILEFGITHQPHEGGGWCEMWREIRRHTLRHHQ